MNLDEISSSSYTIYFANPQFVRNSHFRAIFAIIFLVMCDVQAELSMRKGRKGLFNQILVLVLLCLLCIKMSINIGIVVFFLDHSIIACSMIDYHLGWRFTFHCWLFVNLNNTCETEKPQKYTEEAVEDGQKSINRRGKSNILKWCWKGKGKLSW